MTQRSMRIVFSSGISGITEQNSSFDRGVLRVAYTGKNRNNSFISKETFERCMPSIYNCPIVCNYRRDEDEIGAHDMELVSDGDGNMRIVNVTQPVGVVPESANYHWEEIEDEGGIHEYLCIDVLLWKRQDAYRKIKANGVTDESMEISVKEGKMVDGVYVIDRFEFTAFCLLGTAEPCYEGASLEVFSCGEFKKRLAEMMQEFKDMTMSQRSFEVDKHQENDLEGGDEALEEKIKLLGEFGLSEADLDFKLEDCELCDLRTKLEAMSVTKVTNAGDGDGAVKDQSSEAFALEGQFREEIFSAVQNGSEKVETCWGLERRYFLWDYDHEASEVYVEDVTDWNIYALPFTMDGDHVVIDFTQKKRMKLALAPFDEGGQSNPMAVLFNELTERYAANDKQWAEKYQAENEKVTAMEDELCELRKFKEDTVGESEKMQREQVFSQFEDLAGTEAFEALRADSSAHTVEELEEKCFAIRGRMTGSAKFSHEPKAPKLPVEKMEKTFRKEPYGGVFAEYGFSAEGKS